MTDPTAPPTPRRRPDCPPRVDESRRQLADVERALQQILDTAGRRPDEGSDQPGMFPADAQPRLWCPPYGRRCRPPG
jgi:hypothetical protein